LQESLEDIPPALQHYQLDLSKDGHQLSYTFSTKSGSSYKSAPSNIETLINELNKNGINFNDIDTTQSSLEEIFIQLVKDNEKELSSAAAEDKS
jgi:ABC-2 type transport system ATP-binding protein